MKSAAARFGLLSSVILSTFMMPCAQATEGGSNQYPLGVNSALPALRPEAGGTALLDYTELYSAAETVGPTGQRVVPGFHINVTAEVLRFLHTWVQEGPISITSGVVQPLVNIDLHPPFSTNSIDVAGVANTVLQPLYINFQTVDHTFFASLGVMDIWVPDGHFIRQAAVNTGINYLSYGPELDLTWFATQRLQLSLAAQLEFSAKDNATDYHSGATIDFDYGVDYAPFGNRAYHVGVGGYAYQQFTDDTLGGVVYNGGNRGRVIAIGPQLRYDWKMGGVIVKWQHEFAVENRTKGDAFWLQFAVPLAL